MTEPNWFDQLPAQPDNLGVVAGADNVIEFNPTLPNGADGLPDFHIINTAGELVANTSEHPWLDAYEAGIQHLTEAERVLVRRYYPLAWMKVSTYLDYGHASIGGTVVCSLPLLREHIEAAEKAVRKAARDLQTATAPDRAAAKAVRGDMAVANTAAWMDWQEQCRQRKLWIATKAEAWRAGVAARKAAVVQWDAHVAALRADMDSARGYPAPPRPAGVAPQ